MKRSIDSKRDNITTDRVSFVSDNYSDRSQQIWTRRGKYDLDIVFDFSLALKMGTLTFQKKWLVSLNVFPWVKLRTAAMIAWHPRNAIKWKSSNGIRKQNYKDFGLSSNMLWLIVKMSHRIWLLLERIFIPKRAKTLTFSFAPAAVWLLFEPRSTGFEFLTHPTPDPSPHLTPITTRVSPRFCKMAASGLLGIFRRLSRTEICPIRNVQKPLSAAMLTRQKSSSTLPSSAENAKEANWKCRQDLATAFRGLHWYGLSEGVCTHLTMMAPALSGEGEVMLMIPHGLHWSQVCKKLINLFTCIITKNKIKSQRPECLNTSIRHPSL